ncbi:hypothetical protein NYZ17_20585, partial [Acinetobacter baumannii]|nr:hypothetical protein [Acinetobacter baumannii]
LREQMMRKSVSFAFAIAASISTNTFGQSQDVHSGNFVMKVCETEILACYSYITGVIGGMQVQAIMDEKKIHYCRPEGVTTEQIRQIFLKRLR